MQFFWRRQPPSAPLQTPGTVNAPFPNPPLHPSTPALQCSPTPISTDVINDAPCPHGNVQLPVPLHSLLENTRLRVFSYHELRRMLLQLRLGGWSYPHLVALCILLRHVYVRVRAVTATILTVFALLHSVTRLSARHCRLVPAGHAVDPDPSEFSNRPQSLHVTGPDFADPQAMPSCPHVSAQALCLDSLTYGSNAFEFACLLLWEARDW